MKLRVVKTGGSLLVNPQLAASFRTWRAAQPPALEVHICGCGLLADAVRKVAAVQRLNEQICHTQCLKLLSVSATLFAEISGIARIAERLDQVNEIFAAGATACIYNAVGSWSDDPAVGFARRAPATWDVTTDSIAAMLCKAAGGDELVLLKSAPPPSQILEDAAQSGYLDAYFPMAAEGVARIRCVDLMAGADGFAGTEMQWKAGS